MVDTNKHSMCHDARQPLCIVLPMNGDDDIRDVVQRIHRAALVAVSELCECTGVREQTDGSYRQVWALLMDVHRHLGQLCERGIITEDDDAVMLVERMLQQLTQHLESAMVIEG